MRSAPLGPRAGLPPDMVMPLAIIGLIWGVLGSLGILWALGATVGWAATGEWTPPPFAFNTAADALRVGPPAAFRAPAMPLYGAWAGAGLVLTAAIGVWMARAASRPMADDPLASLANPSDLSVFTPGPATVRARALRPTLPRTGRVAGEDVGLALGELEPKGPLLRASWEDVLLAIMAPRAGKTTSLSVPMVLSAPGAVIATSNKPDLLMATHALRRATGTCWVFDPQGIAHSPRRFTYNPLDQVRTVADAGRLAKHFVQEVVDGSRGAGGDFWTKAAGDLLTSLLLAAACSGRDLSEVFRWLNDSAARLPVQLLRSHGHVAAASSLEGRQNGAVETREGIYETARTAAQSLRDPEIMAWVTPDPELPAFNPAMFVATRGTVYAMSKDGGGSASPLVAALVDSLMRTGIHAAECAAGRLDPPMVAVLDEAANVAKINDLPELYSHLGSRGLLPVTILQSYRQGVRVWGETGMDALWSAATVKLIGAGIDDPKFAEEVSKLVGEHDIVVRSASHGRDTSSQLSLRRQRILPPESVRALPKGRALLLATGMRAGLVKLQPWYSGPAAPTIGRAITAAESAITERARSETTT